MWIAKISGITNFDAAVSVDVSSDFAIGVIIEDFDEIRHVSKFDARRIFANIKNCVTVAEIKPTSINDIFDTIDTCYPQIVQINGDFFDDINNLIELQSIITIPIIGSIFLDKQTLKANILDPDPIKAAETLDQFASIININLPLDESWRDIKKKNRITQLIQDIRSKITKPLVIGGGFKTSNVGKIVQDLSPDAVDVSSGVERITGMKDSAMMQEFLQTVYDFKESLSGVDVNTI
ncbi:MAG: hypothetical protein KAS95_01620 [Candidatus Heimdallarchaeota archaeon]|nr:hypothetical protein [Candidatus Heimdallarchaeota archaeon]